MSWASSAWSSSTSTRSTRPVNWRSTPWRMPAGWAMMALVVAARRSLADRPSRISCVRRLAAVRASLSVGGVGDAGAVEVARLDALLARRAARSGRGAVDEHDADVQRAQHRDIEQDVGEVLVRDDGAVDGEDEGRSRKCGT